MNRPNILSKTVSMLAGVLALAGMAKAESVKPAVSATDPLAPRYESTLVEGIDFRKPGYPSFLKEVNGVFGLEPWGRWTDANINPTAIFKFGEPLPKKFALQLMVSAFGPNARTPVSIRAGKVTKTLVVIGTNPQIYKVNFTGVNSDTIEFIPPKPTAPNELNPTNGDTRKLGLGMVTMQIVAK